MRQQLNLPPHLLDYKNIFSDSNMLTQSSRGFQPKLPTKSEIATIRDRFLSIVRQWRTNKLKVVFGFLNALVYRACRLMGVLKQSRRARGARKGFHQIVGDIKAIALHGIRKFNITIEGIKDQLANFWCLNISEPSLRKYRYELRDVFEIFHFTSEPFPAGKVGDSNNRRPPALEDFDLVLACLLLECLESILINERGCSLDDFPGKAAISRLIYNALFGGVSSADEGRFSYRRQNPGEDPIVWSQGDRHVRVSEMDWCVALTEKGASNWGVTVTLVPDEYGILPELI